MGDFTKAIKALRSEGIGVHVESFMNDRKTATIDGEGISGGITRNMKSVTFDEEELSVIRELLSGVSCGFQRKTYFHHCCDANEIIEKINKTLGNEHCEELNSEFNL